jgi:cytochrome P450
MHLSHTNAGELLGKGAITTVTNAAEHRLLRGLLQPAFTADAVQKMVPEIVTCCEAALREWAAASSAAGGGSSVAVLGWPRITRMTFSVIVRVSWLCKLRLGGICFLCTHIRRHSAPRRCLQAL